MKDGLEFKMPPMAEEPENKKGHLEKHAEMMLESNLPPELRKKISQETKQQLTKILAETALRFK